MTDPALRIAPQRYARLAGLLYVVIFATALFSVFVEARLVVAGNAAATASHILASQSLWRGAFSAELVAFGCDIPLALLFYVLLRPVNANVALLAALFRFGESIMGSLNALWHLAPLVLLGGNGYLKAFQPAQLQALALLSLKLYDRGWAINLVLFGVHCILLGYLIFKARYFPKTLGVLLVIAGACYVINSFAIFLAPAVANVINPAILLPPFVAELGLCIWLLVFGVNVTKWNEQVASFSAAG